jgi:mxaJ protein
MDHPAGRAHLVACADPNDLPFSNRAREGFENKIIELVGRDLGAGVTYLWWPQRRGYIRKTLNASKCDVWPGTAAGVGGAATTRPYYRSMYVFVTRKNANLARLTLDDPRLRSATIGVQLIGNDATNTPPAHAIASRGITDNVRGYMVYGDYGRPNPPAAIVDAVETRQIDVALVWGPLAGYLAHRSHIPLRLDPVTPAGDPRWPMAFDISMAVRRGDRDLLDRINAILGREQPRIDAILEHYHVPLESAGARSAAADVPLRQGR